MSIAQIFTAPNAAPDLLVKSVFLAGSIDMGAAVDWQKALIHELEHMPVAIFNPRRDDFDVSLKQEMACEPFAEQVRWELDHLDKADVICFYFDVAGKAPVTLLELGLHATTGKAVVCCPEGYWRRGNVEILCDRYEIPFFDGFAPMVAEVKRRLGDLTN